MKRNRVVKLRIDELSLVDRPANEGALVTMTKRASLQQEALGMLREGDRAGAVALLKAGNWDEAKHPRNKGKFARSARPADVPDGPSDRFETVKAAVDDAVRVLRGRDGSATKQAKAAALARRRDEQHALARSYMRSARGAKDEGNRYYTGMDARRARQAVRNARVYQNALDLVWGGRLTAVKVTAFGKAFDESKHPRKKGKFARKGGEELPQALRAAQEHDRVGMHHVEAAATSRGAEAKAHKIAAMHHQKAALFYREHHGGHRSYAAAEAQSDIAHKWSNDIAYGKKGAGNKPPAKVLSDQRFKTKGGHTILSAAAGSVKEAGAKVKAFGAQAKATRQPYAIFQAGQGLSTRIGSAKRTIHQHIRLATTRGDHELAAELKTHAKGLHAHQQALGQHLKYLADQF